MTSHAEQTTSPSHQADGLLTTIEQAVGRGVTSAADVWRLWTGAKACPRCRGMRSRRLSRRDPAGSDVDSTHSRSAILERPTRAPRARHAYARPGSADRREARKNRQWRPRSTAGHPVASSADALGDVSIQARIVMKSALTGSRRRRDACDVGKVPVCHRSRTSLNRMSSRTSKPALRRGQRGIGDAE